MSDSFDFYQFLKQGGSFLLVIFVLFCLYMYFKQDSIIYVPEVSGMKYPEDNPMPYQCPSQMKLNYKNVEIITKDNIKLHGWLVFTKNVKNKTLVYYHENAGNIGLRIPFFSYVIEFLGLNILTVGYRGFGRSEGIPSEEGLKLDGEAIASWVFDPSNKIAEELIDTENVFLFGRSLGGAVLAHVASSLSLPLKGVIIENTFTNMGALCELLYPALKFVYKFLLRSKWETDKIIHKIRYPILFCRSEKDELIPKSQMDKLYQLATGTKYKETYVIKDGTHNEGYIYDKIGYKNAILSFIDTCNGFKKGDKEFDKSSMYSSGAETVASFETKKNL